ncbi:MAG: hypothetical protein RIM23_23770 [Coleofasciculus sp. G3-WIS-01]|uniref:hypothetical protein n=1 Tax=Coleofasciculus sp. G3-WIS-01 TaxID=3069528 RepID=UPI0032F5909E
MQNTIVVGDHLEALLNQQFESLSQTLLQILFWLQDHSRDIIQTAIQVYAAGFSHLLHL